MPVRHIPVREIGQESFKKIDYKVMGLAYAVQNEIGRLFEEDIYRERLAQKTRQVGLRADTEVHLSLSHETYTKDFYIDLLVGSSVIYELKCCECFNPSHDAQLIQYLHLTGAQHGKLINFRTQSVDGRFASTTMRLEERRDVGILKENWQEAPATQQIESILRALLLDWGACLSVETYRDALQALIPDATNGRVEAKLDGEALGSIETIKLDSNTALQVTGFSNDNRGYKNHLLRILEMTSLDQIHWINIDRKTIRLSTIFLH